MDYKKIHTIQTVRAGEVAQVVKTCAALAEDLSGAPKHPSRANQNCAQPQLQGS